MATTVYYLGYSLAPSLTVTLFYPGQNGSLFFKAKETLDSIDAMEPKYFTKYYPAYELDKNSNDVKDLVSFVFDEWEFVAGVFDEDGDCSQVLIRNKENWSYSLVYDLHTRTLLAVMTNGYGVVMDGRKLANEEIETFVSKANPKPIIKPEPQTIFDFSSDRSQTYIIVNGKKLEKPQAEIMGRLIFSLEDTNYLAVNEKTRYYPLEEKDRFDERLTTAFFFEDWTLVAAKINSDGSKKVYGALLANKVDPELAIVVSPFYKCVFSVVTAPVKVSFDGRSFSLEELLLSLKEEEKPKENENPPEEVKPSEATPSEKNSLKSPFSAENEPKIETPQSEASKEPPVEKNEKPKEEPAQENSPSQEEDEAFFSLTVRRRLYCTRRYLRSVKDKVKTYGAELEKTLDKIYQWLISSDDEELANFLKRRDAKKFQLHNQDISIYKFRVSSSATFKAHRLFFARGDDGGREIDSSSFVLLYYSNAGEHDEQGEIAALLDKTITEAELKEIGIGDGVGEDTLIGNKLIINQELYCVPYKENSDPKEPSYNHYGVVSKEQKDLLIDVTPPCIYSGSAGTGKTLMSVDLFRRYKEENPNAAIAYVTYQAALKNQIQRTFDELGIRGDAYSYGEIALKQLGFSGKTEVTGIEELLKWLKSYTMSGEKKILVSKISSSLEKAADIIFIFFRGVLSGSSKTLNKQGGKILSREDFLNEIKDENSLTQEQRDALFLIGKDYGKHLEKEGLWTDNDLARTLLDKKDAAYDALIIDEAQDLSELQLYSLLSLLKESSSDIYLFGDDNQAINPSLFTLEKARSCLQSHFGSKVKIRYHALHSAYRSSLFLVQYINNFNRVKRTSIGHYGYENDQDETSVRQEDEGLLPGLVSDPVLIKNLLSSPIPFEKDTVILTPSLEEKQRAIEKFPAIHPSNIQTISEAKGREWDNTILYRFFSSEKELWEAMLGEGKRGKRSTIHRMLFNRFYVALTRAKNGILILEDEAGELVSQNFLSTITHLSTSSECESYFAGVIGDDDWYNFALSKFNERQYIDCLKCLRRIPLRREKEKFKNLEDDAINISFFKDTCDKNGTFKAEQTKQIAESLLRRGDKINLATFYRRRKLGDLAELLRLGDKLDSLSAKKSLNTILKHQKDLSYSELLYFYNLISQTCLKDIAVVANHLHMSSKEA